MVHLRIQLKKKRFLIFMRTCSGNTGSKMEKLFFLFAGTWYTGPNFFVDKLRIEWME